MVNLFPDLCDFAVKITLELGTHVKQSPAFKAQHNGRRGVEFAHGPRRSYWGYGAELADPDGYLVRLWDERSMKEQ